LKKFLEGLKKGEKADLEKKNNWRDCFNHIIIKNPYQVNQEEETG
jgi:hypothetical protein